LRNFIPYLSEHGFFVIGDIAFHNNAGMQACKESAGGDWDDEEYWLEDQSISFLTQMHMHVGFTQTSDFSGVFKIVVSTDLPMH
jgi:hypothetical protein